MTSINGMYVGLLSLFISAQAQALSVSSITLVKTSNNTDIQTLTLGSSFNLANTGTSLNIRANISSTPGSVVFLLDGSSHTENMSPYYLAGKTNGLPTAWTPTVGTHSLKITPWSGSNASGTAGTSTTISFTVSNASQALSVSSITLVNASNNTDIQALTTGSSFDMSDTGTSLNIRANISSTPGSVVFALDGASHTESVYPYYLGGKTNGLPSVWTPSVGTHSLKITPWSGSGGTGTAGSSTTISFTVSDGGSVSSGSTWRPFNSTSPWNTLIGPNPAIDPESYTMIQDFANSSPYGTRGWNLDVNLTGYTIPIFYATSSTPTVTVTVPATDGSYVAGMGWATLSPMAYQNVKAQMPFPSGAAPENTNEAHMVVIDKTQNIEWGCYYMRYSATSGWTAKNCAKIDLSGSGVVQPPTNASSSTWFLSHTGRACGIPLSAGEVRPEEIQAGHIDHALVIGYPHIRSGWYTSPAATAQVGIDNAGIQALSTRGIPCGGRIQFDPSVDLDSLGLNAADKIIMKALQDYGAYIGDASGAISIYADSSPTASAYWTSGVLSSTGLHGKIDLTLFRVIKMGTVYDNHNENGH